MKDYFTDMTDNPLIGIVIIAIMLDTVLGVLRAIKEHEFNSTVGIDGGIRKISMLMCILGLHFADVLLNIDCLFMIPDGILKYIGIKQAGLCEFFSLLFALYEIASILKNMVLCGLPIPKKSKEFINKFLYAMTDEMPSKKKEE